MMKSSFHPRKVLACICIVIAGLPFSSCSRFSSAKTSITFIVDSIVLKKIPFEDNEGIPFDVDGGLDPYAYISGYGGYFTGRHINSYDSTATLYPKKSNQGFSVSLNPDGTTNSSVFGFYLHDIDTVSDFSVTAGRLSFSSDQILNRKFINLSNAFGDLQIRLYMTWK